ncbi:uncharacterized protein LOC142357783, partial [Convolutriloba macropyga]|uniref:uncharacterized protein LOC142357783 n=1 Tax=Convolutriloba macropyga TaxID=536237 RepID=UPI003F51D91A
NVLNCTVSTTNQLVESTEVSTIDYTSAERPVVLLATSPENPDKISVEFYLPDFANEYQKSLERDGSDISGVITNPYLDTGLTPATVFNYRGFLIGNNGALSPASQTVSMCTHPQPPVGLAQNDASTGTVTVQWSDPDNAPA